MPGAATSSCRARLAAGQRDVEAAGVPRAARGRPGPASEPGASRSSRTFILARPISGKIAAWRSRPPRARRTWVASAGNWLSVGSTGSHSPRPRSSHVDLRPGVVVEARRAGRRARPRSRAGMPQRARQRHVERRVLVAVADARAQHLARRGQAHRRLLLEQRVHVADEALGLRARARWRPRGRLRPRPRSPARRSR